MKVRVRLYGVLRGQFPDYRHCQGMEVEIPDGATVRDLLLRLRISESQKAFVSLESRVLKADDVIPAGVQVNVLQAVAGG
jgi:sulfur carrier protein ThiS